MHINRLELKGFMSYRDTTIIEFPDGIIGITGCIEDDITRSNGSGKSSIVMAILFALYGTGIFSKKDEVWFDSLPSGEEVYVKLFFELNGNNYTIQRGGKKATSSYLTVYENDVKCGSSIKESQEFINSLMCMDSWLFTASVFFSQNDISSFITTTPQKRREYIDSVLDIAIYGDMYKICNKDRKAVENSIATMKVDIDTDVEKAKQVKADINKIDNIIKNKNKLKQEHDKKMKELLQIESVKTIIKTVKEYESMLEVSITEKTKLDNKEQELEQSIEKTKNILDGLQEIEQVFEQYKDFNEEQQQASIKKLSEEISVCEEEINNHTERRNILEKEIIALNIEIQNLEKDKYKLSVGICSQCGKEISEEDVQFHQAEIEKNITNIKKRKIDIEKNSEVILQEIQKKTATLTLNKEEISKIERRFSEYERMKNEYNMKMQYKERMTEDLKRYDKELGDIDQRIKETTVLINKYTVDIETLKNKIPKNFDSSVEEVQQEIAEIEEALSDIDKKTGMVDHMRKILLDIESNISKNKDEMKRLYEEVNTLSILAQAFKQIPVQIFNESILAIEIYANEIIQNILTHFKVKLYIDETKERQPLNVAFEINNEYRNYNMLSGGQQVICALGLRIGFSKVITQRSRTSINFLVLDEIFGALDESNRKDVIRILTEISNYFKQIFVITHTEEASMFPYNINVLMNSEGISTCSF